MSRTHRQTAIAAVLLGLAAHAAPLLSQQPRLLPELIQDLKNEGLTDRDLDPLFRSAEGYIRMWERAVASVPVP